MSWFYPYKPGVVLGLTEAAHMLQMHVRLDGSLSKVRQHLDHETEREWEVRKIMQVYIDDEKREIPEFESSTTPPPWRHQGIAWHWGMRVTALYLQHKMGLGKTREGADIVRGKYDHGQAFAPIQTWLPERASRAQPDKTLPERHGTKHGVLVVCPAGVMVEWLQQLKRWQGIEALPIVGTPERKRMRAGTPAWVHVVSYESLGAVEDNEYDGIIADELHYAANEDSNRFPRLWAVRERARWVVGLSGTPQTNGLTSLWAQYYFLDGGRTLGSTYQAFKRKYFNKETKHLLPEGGAEEAITHAISRISWPYSMQQAFKDKPQKIHQTIRVPMTAAQVRYYEIIRKEQEADIVTGKVSLFDAMNRLTKLMQVTQGFVLDNDKVVQQFSSAKLDALQEMLGPKGDLHDKRVIVWCNFSAEVVMISNMLKKLGKRHLILRGGLSQNAKTLLKDEWNENYQHEVLVGMISMGIGLNLHAPKCVDDKGRPARVSTTVFYGWNWRVSVLEQAMDRTYRGDQVETCLYRYLLSDDLEESDGSGKRVQPIDVRVYESLMAKLEQGVRVDENSIAYVRSLLAA